MKFSILSLLICTAMVAFGLMAHRAHIRADWYRERIRSYNDFVYNESMTIHSEFQLREAELLVPIYQAGIDADSPEMLERLARRRYVQRLSEHAKRAEHEP